MNQIASLNTSIKTRIETKNPDAVTVTIRNPLSTLPLKQGLKLKQTGETLKTTAALSQHFH